MTTAVNEPYDRQREEHARDLLRSWADAAGNAGCPPAFVARMRTFADMHDQHADEAEDGTKLCRSCGYRHTSHAAVSYAVCPWHVGDARRRYGKCAQCRDLNDTAGESSL